jgi:hypothetical protein
MVRFADLLLSFLCSLLSFFCAHLFLSSSLFFLLTIRRHFPAACGLRRAQLGTPGPRPSLSELTQKFLGATTTPPSAQYADRVWERTPLSHTERWFAAEGAWIAVEIHGTLSFTHGPQVRPG